MCDCPPLRESARDDDSARRRSEPPPVDWSEWLGERDAAPRRRTGSSGSRERATADEAAQINLLSGDANAHRQVSFLCSHERDNLQRAWRIWMERNFGDLAPDSGADKGNYSVRNDGARPYRWHRQNMPPASQDGTQHQNYYDQQRGRSYLGNGPPSRPYYKEHPRRRASCNAEQENDYSPGHPSRQHDEERNHSGMRMRLNRSSVDRIAKGIIDIEGGPTAINWNDNGRGISFGPFQANQKGDLPRLLRQMHEHDPATFERVFGRHSDDLLDARHVRNMKITRNSDLGRRLELALTEPSMQAACVDFLRDKIETAARTAARYGVTSEVGVALFADLINQMGEGGAKKYFRRAQAGRSEASNIAAIAESSGDNRWRRSRNPQVFAEAREQRLSGAAHSFESSSLV